MSIDVERFSQKGQKGEACASPETLKVYSRDASQTEYVTTLTRWNDNPFTVEKRVKKYGSHDRTVKTIVPKLTPQVREKLDEIGVDYD